MFRARFLLVAALCSCAEENGGGGDAGGNGETGNGEHESASTQCVDIINMYRATLGLPPYVRWVDGEDCAADEARQDSESGEPHGAFGQCDESAQNECPGWSGPPEDMIGPCLELMWAEGPGADFQQHGHYINMSSTDYTEVACGFSETSSGDIWAVQNFR